LKEAPFLLFWAQAESKKSELETLLSTNLVKRQQELQAQLAQSDSQTIIQDVDLRKQELKEAKITVDEAVRQLKCMYQI